MDSCIYENGKIFTSDGDHLYGDAMLVETALSGRWERERKWKKWRRRDVPGWILGAAG